MIKTNLLQILKGALCSVPLNVLMLVVFIGVIRILDSTDSSALTALNFPLAVRLVLFIPPAIVCAVMAVIRRSQPEKRLFWIAAAVFQVLLLALIQPNFDM